MTSLSSAAPVTVFVAAPPESDDELDDAGQSDANGLIVEAVPAQIAPRKNLYTMLPLVVWSKIFSYLRLSDMLTRVMCLNSEWFARATDVRNERKHPVARFSGLGAAFWADLSDDDEPTKSPALEHQSSTASVASNTSQPTTNGDPLRRAGPAAGAGGFVDDLEGVEPLD